MRCRYCGKYIELMIDGDGNFDWVHSKTMKYHCKYINGS